MTVNQLLDDVRRALRSEPRLAEAARGIEVAVEQDALALEGEVPSVAAKKLALEHAAALPGVTAIVDRLRVTPAQPMGDKEIRDHIERAYLQEPAFEQLALFQIVNGERMVVRDSPVDTAGTIIVEVADGVVALNGDIPTLAHKRLAGVLAWWVPGSRDVINGLAVTSPETPLDAETTDAVYAALQKDPFVKADQIKVFTKNNAVRLEGLVPSEAERDMAENDAWYVFGVDRVDNQITVAP